MDVARDGLRVFTLLICTSRKDERVHVRLLRVPTSEAERSSEGYSALGGFQWIRGFQLVHSVTGEKLDLSVELDLLNYSFTEIRLRFKGAAGEVEKLRAAVRPVLEECMQK